MPPAVFAGALPAPAAASPSGLTSAEAAARLQRDGFNELPNARRRPLLTIALGVLREPMLLLLLASCGVYVLLGDPEESVAMLAAVLVVVAITLVQEYKTERALEALRELSSPHVLVIRDGGPTRVAGREVVRGDAVILREGDRVPADGVLETSTNLLIDESLLTGESLPVRKRKPASHSDGTDDTCLVHSGTLVVGGEAVARVTETGVATALGRIGTSLNAIEIEQTQLQREMAAMVRTLAVAGAGACVVLAVVYGATRGWLDGALAGLTLAISMVPEEFPVVLTVFLALGAWRISRSRVLTRRMPAIETLGSATVLCVDKTGTLTMNRMQVAAVDPAVAAGDVLATALMAGKLEAFDPMERAIGERAAEQRIGPPADSRLAREYAMTDTMPAVVHAWQRTDGSAYTIAAKGAPEAVASLCRLSDEARAAVLDRVNAMAATGLRVIAVARSSWSGPLPESVSEFRCEFAGLLGFADPVRPGVPEAIQECAAASIRVVMITGDYPMTALNVAAQIGMRRSGECLTGSDIAAVDDEELRRRVRDVDVFARITPPQKLRLVRALKANGEVVAMTGDGVNDAPALKAADIGVAMGARGTDVAREAATLVLLDDDFSSIVRAVRLGRRIYANIQKATAYILAVHLPIAGMALLPVLAGWPLMLMPMHVIFLELIVDPMCTIAFEMEPEEREVMRLPPRDPRARLFTRRLVARSLLQGLGAFAAGAAVFLATARLGFGEWDVRALTFTTLILVNLALIVTNRSLTEPVWVVWRRPNPAMRWLGFGAVVLLGAVLYVPMLRDVFRIAMPHPPDLAIVAVAGLAALGWMEGVKRITVS